MKFFIYLLSILFLIFDEDNCFDEIQQLKHEIFNLKRNHFNSFFNNEAYDSIEKEQSGLAKPGEYYKSNSKNDGLRDEEIELHSSLIAGHQYVSGNKKNLNKNIKIVKDEKF